jgi:NADPH:quinone reductase-like Zn-dependent oxidoreductase
MRAVTLDTYGSPPSLRIASIPEPVPAAGEVLVRVAAASVNPSDLAFLRGRYGVRKRLPVVPGFEGSGVVVATGAGAESLRGARVALAAGEGDGTWAEYAVARARHCIPLREGADLEAAASLVINPMSAWALLDVATAGEHRAAISTAAAGALGRMLARLAQRRGYPLLHVVRRPAQVTALHALGAEYVLDSSADGFAEKLAAAAAEHKATIAFDAVGGPLTAQLLAALPRGGRVLVYGALADTDVSVSPLDLVFGGKRIDGFWLSEWLRARTERELTETRAAVQARLADDLRTDVRLRVPLAELPDAIGRYAAEMTAGKVLLIPSA